MRYLLCLWFAFISIFAFAQDPIAEKMDWYGKAKPSANLFIHFDKNIYTNYETVWFTGYLLKEGYFPSNNHKIMAISLVRNIDSAVILTRKFTMLQGISFGNFEIPDSVQAGDYHFLAFTNQLANGLPEATFTQQITLKTTLDPPFKASIKLMDQPKENDKSYKVLVSVTTNDNRFLPKPVSLTYRYGDEQKSAKTDASGQFLMTLPFQPLLSNPNVYVKLNNKTDSTFISMPLPILKNKASVKFYPEGGNIVAGFPTVVGFEVKDQQKMPIATKAFLYRNQYLIDTVETSSYGLGKFKLRFEQDANYTLKLIHDGVVDSIYQLPKAQTNGINLTIVKAIVADTVKLQLKSIHNQNLFIRVHDFRKTYLITSFHLEYSSALKIPLTEMPKGLLTITIADSLNRPLVERIIFAHYDGKENLKLTTDQSTYPQRTQVALKLHLADTASMGLVSIAVVQNNRIDVKKINDIENYTYLKNLLAEVPTHISGLPYRDEAYLEQLVLIKGWRKYNWQDLQQAKESDTTIKNDSLTFTAQITKGKKFLDKSITVGAFGDSKLRVGNTSSKGIIDLNNLDFMTNEKKNLYLFINDANKAAYNINLHDQFILMGQKLRKLSLNDEIILPSTLANNAVLVLKGNEKAIRLKEVVIKSTKDDFINLPGQGLPGRNACGDYVCRFNILNCPNHQIAFDNTQPVTGHTYTNSKGPYMGCIRSKKEGESSFVVYDCIRYGKEFYVDDYKDLREPALFSTIYWNYGVNINGKKDVDIKFHTSDITGKFRVVVQGVINNDVTYAEHFFEVKAKTEMR